MRPLGPSISAGLSLVSVNELKMKSVSETSGIVTSGYGPRKIIGFEWPRLQSLNNGTQTGVGATKERSVYTIAALIAAKLYSEGR